MVKMSSIRVVLGITTSLNLEIEQLDVKTTFLHGDLEDKFTWNNLRGLESTEKKTSYVG